MKISDCKFATVIGGRLSETAFVIITDSVHPTQHIYAQCAEGNEKMHTEQVLRIEFPTVWSAHHFCRDNGLEIL